MPSENPLRPARAGDAPEMAELATQLGYPSPAAEVERRLGPLLGSPDHLVLAAVDAADRPVGWLHAAVRRQVERETDVQVVALVVGDGLRGRGIGARLLAAAEAWAVEIGAAAVRLRSNVVRERAHGFYLRLGYAKTKTSHLFVKKIDG